MFRVLSEVLNGTEGEVKIALEGWEPAKYFTVHAKTSTMAFGVYSNSDSGGIELTKRGKLFTPVQTRLYPAIIKHEDGGVQLTNRMFETAAQASRKYGAKFVKLATELPGVVIS